MTSRTRFAVAGLVAVAALVAVPVAVNLSRHAAAAQERERSGRTIWLGDCAVCHGATGEGTARGPSLRDAGVASVDFNLRTGRMPIDPTEDPVPESERGDPAYTPEEIAAVVEHTRAFVDGPDIPEPDVAGADLARGSELYLLNCAGCHQSIGTGGALARGQHAPTLTDSSPVEVAEAVRVGPGTMPAFPPAVFDEEQLSDLVAYVDEITSPEDRGGWAIGHFGPVTEGLVAWAGGLLGIVLVTRWLGARARDDAGRGH